MWIAEYYKTLSMVKNSGVTLNDVKEIVESMPRMLDSRDYLQTFIYPVEPNEHHEACQKTLDQMLYLMNGVLYHHCIYDDSFSIQNKVKVLEMWIKVLNMFNDDNFGSNWCNIIYNYGHLGHMYFELGDEDKSLLYLRKSAQLAKKFDELPQITQRHSILFDGSEFDKNVLGSTYVACSRMKYLILEKYPLTDEFKQKVEFRMIINLLDQFCAKHS